MGEGATWFIVLAGGEGKRLASLTRALYGSDLPKQFAVLDGSQSLLQQTVERAATLGRLSHTVVVVTGDHEAHAREQLAAYPGVHLVIQPANLDTGPGLLLPLAYVRARSPSARVVVLPADHHLPNVSPLRLALDRAAHHRASRGRVTLIGVLAEHAETEYGWIVRGERLAGRERDGVWSVRRFVEKPERPVAERLRAGGAVWNTFMATGPLAAFWDLARVHLPAQARAFERWAEQSLQPGAGDRLRTLYGSLRPSNWSSDVLAIAPGRRLALVSMAGSGWSDWGSPSRVFRSMEGTPALASLLARVTGPVPILAP